jgi:hypothetical protein
MKTSIALIFALASHAHGQPAVVPPQLGFVQDSARSLRPVYGVAGNFILGPSVILGKSVVGHVISEAFSGSVGLLKTDSSLYAFDSEGRLLASVAVSSGPALFAFSPAASTALAYIASNNSLVEWRGEGFASISLNDDIATEAVLAIAFPNASQVSLLLQRNDTVWQVNLALGTLGSVSETALLGIHAPLLALPSGDLFYRDTGGMVIRRPDGSEVHVPATLPVSLSLQQMSREWVQLTDLNSNARFAIRTTQGREGFYQLPEITPTSPRAGLLKPRLLKQ